MRQLKMQGWTTKAGSMGARLGSEIEFDGVTRCTSVENSDESKVGLLLDSRFWFEPRSWYVIMFSVGADGGYIDNDVTR
jgi:hypothetical protein